MQTTFYRSIMDYVRVKKWEKLYLKNDGYSAELRRHYVARNLGLVDLLTRRASAKEYKKRITVYMDEFRGEDEILLGKLMVCLIFHDFHKTNFRSLRQRAVLFPARNLCQMWEECRGVVPGSMCSFRL